MPKSVIEIMPNIDDKLQVLLFVDCICVEHYPHGTHSPSIGLTFAEQCSFLGVTLPDNCKYAFYRFDSGVRVVLNEHGQYHCIIISSSKTFYSMDKIPKLEINCIPSQLNTSKNTGVASQLANVAEQQPHFDGVTIQQMRGNVIYGQGDDIDKVGLAQAEILKNAKIVKSKEKMIRALNDAAQLMQKPKNSKK